MPGITAVSDFSSEFSVPVCREAVALLIYFAGDFGRRARWGDIGRGDVARRLGRWYDILVCF